MAFEMTVETIQDVMEWAYEKSINGLPGMGSALEMADDYIADGGSKREQIDALIRWQNTKAATAGFVTSLGGVITLPVAIPANISSTLYVQMRMIAAIAHIAGHDIHNDKVKTMMMVCLTGNAVNEVLKDTGVMLTTKLATVAIKNISSETLKAINKAVGFRLLTKFGTTGVINLGKMVPIIGGLVGAGLDGYTTNLIGDKAREIFLDNSKIFVDVN